MAHGRDIDDIPKSTVRAVAKKLKYYIDVQRREEAFDLSGVEHPMGSFTTHKGGSLYYNSMQDKLTAHFLSQPQLKKYTSEMGLKSPTKAAPRPYSAIMNFIKQDSTMSHDSGKLVNATSKLLLNSNIKHLNRTGSAPSTLRSSPTGRATRRLHRPLSSDSTIPSSTNSELDSHIGRKKRSSRPLKQSTPIPVITSRKTNFQPLIQRIDLESSISSNASSMQSSVTPDDEELMQYTYHGVSRKPSVSDTLLTRSDSVLCMPSMHKRIVTVNKQKSTSAVNKASSFKEPANLTTDISTSVNNNLSSPPVQESNRSTQDASVQVDSSKSSLLNQTADNKKTVAQPATVGRMTATSASVHSIGLQVTESCDSSTQTLSEVGIQTDLSAIMDQKKAERRRLKKQSQENSKSDSSSDSSNLPTVLITSDSSENGKQKSQTDDTSSTSHSEQDMEAARKEELRRHLAATTIQQYYRGFKIGIRAKKSEQEMREQELSLAKSKLPAGIPVHEAARTGNVDRIKELSIEASSLLNLLDERGYTPLHCAVEKGSLESVKMLSICGADMHKETPTGYTAMHIAALSGHVNCLKLLHALECSLKCQTMDRKTPLHLAAMCGHLECCKWLLCNRAKLNARDINDRTALQLAEESGQPHVVDLLTSYENELRYAKGALKQLRARRSNSTEHTDDEGWLSDAKQPDSPAIKVPTATSEVQRQKQFYNQIQQDKEDDDSTFLDVARIAVEKELQTIEEQPDPDQHKLDDNHQHINDQDHQNGDQDRLHDKDQQLDEDQQHDENHQHDDQDQQHDGQNQQHADQDKQLDQAKHDDQDKQHDYQDEENDDQNKHDDQQHQQHNDLGREQHDQDQQSNDQVIQTNQNQHVNDQDNNQDDDQSQQLIHHSQSEQHITNQTSIDEHTDRTGTTGAENQEETPTDTQIVTISQSEIPTDTPQPSDAPITKKINHEGTDTALTVETKDAIKQKDSVSDITSTHNVVTVASEDSKPTSPELTTQDTPLTVTQDSNSQPALLQDSIDGGTAATESRNTSDKIAELSMENLVAHDIANPPLIERTNTQQTLTSVTMLDNPIRLEQLSRSSLDSDYNKNQQITQTISTTAVVGDKKPSDDVILITGTVDTGAVKSSVSSSTLSSITDLTE